MLITREVAKIKLEPILALVEGRDSFKKTVIIGAKFVLKVIEVECHPLLNIYKMGLTAPS